MFQRLRVCLAKLLQYPVSHGTLPDALGKRVDRPVRALCLGLRGGRAGGGTHELLEHRRQAGRGSGHCVVSFAIEGRGFLLIEASSLRNGLKAFDLVCTGLV
jgi:hypothetical protein